MQPNKPRDLDERMAAWAGLDKAGTPVPWEVERIDGYLYRNVGRYWADVTEEAVREHQLFFTSVAIVPDLIAEVARLREAVNGWKELKELSNQMEDAAELRAARMAEALGELEYVADKLRGGGYYPYDDAAVDIDAAVAASSGSGSVWLKATEKRAAAAELVRVAGSRYIRKGSGLAERLQIVVSNAHLVSQDLDVVTSTDLRDRAADLTDEANVLEGK